MIEAKPALVRIVAAKGTHPAARYTAARALIVLDAKDAAPQLFQAAQESDGNLRQQIEPALARWKHAPAYDVWRKRLKNANHRELMLALRCLGDVRDKSALPQVLAILHDRQRLDAERLAAARAAGQLSETSLEADAQKLAASGERVVDRLCAAALLERHESSSSRTLLLALAVDREPSVATAALHRLNAIDFSLVLPLAEQVLQNPDAGVRREGARAYVARPNAERIMTLGKLLDDPHPGLRAMVREDLR